ncbi:MAG: hypothetical protein WBP61_08855 [Nocardioides sp.]
MLLLPLLLLALAPAPAPTPVDVLRDWDEQRALAWSTADPAALRGLYTPGSAAGRRDLAMLDRWRARGLRVEGIRMQLLEVDTRRRTPDRLVLDVTDRLTGATAAPGRLTLPRDRPSRHVVTMVRVAGEWRVRSVLSATRRG